VGTQWRPLEADLARADWRDAKNARSRWGGREGLVCQLGMRLDFPLGEKGIVQVRDVSLLGDSAAADAPPRIEPLPDERGRMRFRIEDPAGVRPGGLLLAVNGLVFDLRSRALKWDGQVLSWDAPHVCDEQLAVYVEAANREGQRGSLELHRAHPRMALAGAKPQAVGFPCQHRSHSAEVKGLRTKYRVQVAGRHEPINRSIEIQGAVADPKVLVKGQVDLESPRTVARSLFREGMTEREKAYAIWRWEMRTASSLGVANPIDRTKYMNVFGYGYCTSHAQTVQALAEEAGLPWMFLKYNYPTGHGTQQFLYDGGWHMLDSHQRLYLLTSDGRTVASAEQIEGDPEIICPGSKDITNYRLDQRYPQIYHRPVDINPIHYTRIYKSILGGSMSQSLRAGERLVCTWQGQGRWAHSPMEPLDYANGQLVFRPQATPAALKTEAEAFENIACLDNAAGFRAARAGRKASITYRMASAYLLVGGRASFTISGGSPRSRVRISVSTDGGASWHDAWTSNRAGEFDAVADFDRFLSKRWVEPDSPVFRDVYDLLLKIDLEPAGSPVELSDLQITADLQMHPVALPALRLGENELAFSCARHSGPVTVTHHWDECDAIACSNPEPVAGEEVVLSARLSNRDPKDAGPLEVRFYDGHPDLGGVLLGKPAKVASLRAGRSVTVKTTWIADTRMHRPVLPPYKGYVHTDIFAVVHGAGPARPSNAIRSVAQLRVVVKDRPRLEVEPGFIGWQPKAPRAGQSVRLFAAVWNGSSRKRPYGYGFLYLNGCVLKDVRVRFFEGDPRRGGRRIGQCVLPRIEPLEHALAEVNWRVPARAKGVPIYVEASCAVPTVSGMERCVVRKVLRTLPGGQAGN
jgi:hypothetical protein